MSLEQKVSAALFLLVVLAAPREARADLRLKGRSAIVFLDARAAGGEWAPYRVADEGHPVTFAADGPGAVLLKLRTYAASSPKDPKLALGAVLLDERIVLTARVEAAADPQVRLVDVPGKEPSAMVRYTIDVPEGTHTVTVRYSEGPALLVAAELAPMLEATDSGDVPLVAPSTTQRVERIERLSLSGEDEEEAAPASAGAGDPARDERAAEPVQAERAASQEHPGRDPQVPAHGGARRAVGPAEAEPVEALGPPIPRARVTPRAAAAPLTRPAPYLGFELAAGLGWSRLLHTPGPSVGVGVRVPLPWLDARRFSAGLGADGAYARSEQAVLDGSGTERGIASLERWSLGVELDVRAVLLSLGAVDVHLGAGGGFELGRLAVDRDGARRSGGSTAGFVRLAAGASLGEPGHRPFLEVALDAGAMGSELVRSGGEAGASHLALLARVGYRFELMTDAVVSTR